MSAFTMTSAKAFAPPKLGRSTARRGPVVVRAEKVSHGKGGETAWGVLENPLRGGRDLHGQPEAVDHRRGRGAGGGMCERKVKSGAGWAGLSAG